MQDIHISEWIQSKEGKFWDIKAMVNGRISEEATEKLDKNFEARGYYFGFDDEGNQYSVGVPNG